MLLNYEEHIDSDVVVFDYIVQTNQQQPYDKLAKSLGSAIYPVSSFTESKFAFFIDLIKVIKRLDQPVIVHSHLNYVNALTLTAAFLAGAKIRISHSHSNYNTNLGKHLLRAATRFILRCISNYHWACSEDAGKWLYGSKWFETSPTSGIINNAIDIEEFTFSNKRRERIRKHLNLENKKIWVHVGSLTAAKNHEFLFQVFAEYCKENNDSVLLLCGDGPLKEQLIIKAVSLGIENSVYFLGNVDKVSDVLMGGDLFRLPSKFEGLPVSVLEAQATGIPCITSNVVPESIIIEGLSERIETYDVDAWIQAVKRKLQHQSSRENAHFAISELGYNIKIEAQKLTSVYCKMLE